LWVDWRARRERGKMRRASSDDSVSCADAADDWMGLMGQGRLSSGNGQGVD
jgi:hypothetical protein